MFDEIFRRGMYQLPVGFCPQTIVDIGGNIGLASLYFALAFKNSTVHVFEPVPGNLEILKQNIEANRISNIIIHSYGLGKKDETMRFSLPEAGGFAGYSSEVKGDRSSIEVDIRDVRSVFDELGLHHIDLLKIDCEGAEVDLLHVLSDQFSQIDRIIGEIHLHLTGQKAGYSLIPLLCDTHSVDIKKNLGDNAFIFQAAKLP
jgi:FkbM family methyltransferase